MKCEPKLIAHLAPNPPHINAERFTLDDFVGVGDTVTTTLSDGKTITVICETNESAAYANALILSGRWAKVNAPNKETDA